MKIEVLGPIEPEAFGKACQRMALYSTDCDWMVYGASRVGPGKSTPEGWLEYLLVQKCSNGMSGITIALIQREPGAPFEFHS